ncbi:MAG: hypothetical protein IH962_05210 [Chloroflexi bacterium]|nr:hypothetical protein [Chloroflexota bacterium]
MAPKAIAGLALGASATLVIIGLSVLFLGGDRLSVAPASGAAGLGPVLPAQGPPAFSALVTTLPQTSSPGPSSPGSSNNPAVLYFSSAGAVVMTAGALLLVHQRLLSRFLRVGVTSRRHAVSPAISL